jgi:hypothetical protein
VVGRCLWLDGVFDVIVRLIIVARHIEDEGIGCKVWKKKRWSRSFSLADLDRSIALGPGGRECMCVCMCILVCIRKGVGCLLGYLLYRVTVLTRRFDLDGESHADLPPSLIA